MLRLLKFSFFDMVFEEAVRLRMEIGNLKSGGGKSRSKADLYICGLSTVRLC